jgi:glycosyltransferase involved in cell wall biosynthesis
MSRSPSLASLPPPPHGKNGWPWTEQTPAPVEALPGGAPWPRISIVTPSLNQGRFLEQTIRSVLLQGYPDLEYFIIDAGSTDNSLDLIRKYSPWLAYWISEPDRGQSHAINKGWTRATGSILAWLNSDDYYAPGALVSAGRAFLGAPPDTGIVYGRCCLVDDGGNVLVQYGEPFSLAGALRDASTAIGQPAVFMSADAVRKANGVAEEFHMAMDQDLIYRIALQSRLVFIPEMWAYANDWPESKHRSPVLGFGPDLLESFRRLYRRQDLPPDVRSVKNEALARVALWSAFDHLRAGRYFEMQKCFFLALLHAPRRTWSQAGPGQAVRLALGNLLPWAGAFRRKLRAWGV